MAQNTKEERNSCQKSPALFQRWKNFHGKNRRIWEGKEGAKRGERGLKWKQIQGKGGKIFV